VNIENDNSKVVVNAVVFELDHPHTYESVRRSAQISMTKKRPLLCRMKRHSFETIGEPYYPDGDIGEMVLAVVAATDTRDLRRCKRCGALRVRMRWPA
jgi:hypothetical protein